MTTTKIHSMTMRNRIEDKIGLEPSFSSLDDKGHDPEKRFAVYDAEMEVVCRCERQEVADLIRDLLNAATAGATERDLAWARLVKAAAFVSYTATEDCRSLETCEASYAEMRGALADLQALGVDTAAHDVEFADLLPLPEPETLITPS